MKLAYVFYCTHEKASNTIFSTEKNITKYILLFH